MGLPWNVNASMGGSGVNDQILRSLRFRSSASAYLTRTPSVAGSQTTWTWSGWVKRGALGINGTIFGAYTSAATYYVLQIQSTDQLQHYNQTASSITGYLNTTQVFRDPSAWYHIVAVYNSTNATASNRMALYVNGVQVTTFTTATYPSLNANATVNSTSAHDICRFGGASNYFDGYLAEVNFIDGQALTPASFGYNDPVTGVWQPAPFKGTYGTNGFYLPFTDIATTSGSNFGLGRDYSGNSNYWNTNNISVTAGTTYDSMIDSPTNFSDGSTYYNRGNYAVLNPLDRLQGGSLADGNLSLTASSNSGAYSSIPLDSGKYYAEFTLVTAPSSGWAYIGVQTITGTLYVYRNSNGDFYNNSSYVSYGAAYTSGDIIGLAVDVASGTLQFYKNGASQGLLTGLTFPSQTNYIIAPRTSAGTGTIAANFGQRPFSYTPPTGFKALNTFNLPTPTIANGAAYMAATLYSGDGTNGRSISNGLNNPIGVTFQPDFSWLKQRNGTFDHRLDNSIVTGYRLVSNSTAAEASNFGAFSLTSTGISVSASINDNNSGSNYVAWQWKAGGTSSTNTSGSITSTVSVSAQSGFSVVTYTGTGANATVGHGLGVAPSMYIVKCRSNAGTQWPTYHVSMGATKAMNLDATSSAITYNLFWNNTAPTSSVFSIGSVGADTNINGATFVAYCFAAVNGYSSFGSYTGNGSTDGPFIYTGFRPRFVLVKCSSNSTASTVWTIWDTSRNTYNASVNELFPNLSSAEFVDSSGIDILSNGFKPKRNSEYANFSGWTYVYAAFAENPFNYSRAR